MVTYSDPAEKRFWIQDDTAAVAVDQDPRTYGLQAGQSVNVHATKGSPTPGLAGAPWVRLRDLRITQARLPFKLPAPVASSLRALPERERAGIQVQLRGVVRQVTRDSLGRTQLTFGESGQEALVILSETRRDLTDLVDAGVHLVGIGEASYDETGRAVQRHVWVQSSDDVRIEQTAPKLVPLYSIRSLYRTSNGERGHRLRLRGRIAARPTPASLLLEDRWGAIACQLDVPQDLPLGTPVEVAGFPAVDRLRIDILHSLATPLSASAVAGDDPGYTPPPLTSIATIRELDESYAALALPVTTTGVITFNDSDWRHLFLQDSTGGIFVKYSGSSTPLAQGEQVTVTGISNAGDFAPVIVAPRFRVLGAGKLPQPTPVTVQDASSEVLDSQFVEVEGVIHPVKQNDNPLHLSFELYAPFGKVHVYTSPGFDGVQYVRNLVDTSVRLRGVFGTVFNSRRQLLGYQLSISSAKDITALEPAAPDPFEKFAVPIGSLLRFSPHADFSRRIKVQGSVTLVGRGFSYIQDESGGLEVESGSASLHQGDLVEAVSYASPEHGYSPVLTDAAVRVVKHDTEVSPKAVTPESVSQGQYDSQLVTLDGRLLSVADVPGGKNLILQSGPFTFQAQLDISGSTLPVPNLRESSVLQLTGVCSVQVNPGKLYLLLGQEPRGFHILLRSPGDVKVLHPGSWWTASRTLIVLVVFCTTILAALAWATILRRRVQSQTRALRKAQEKARAIRELARAMEEVTLRKDFSARVSVLGGDDITHLGVGFNQMLAELEVRERATRDAELKLEYQALTDDLTGLPNRRLLADRLSQTLAIAKRERHLVALLYIDLDGFKLVNDSLGHTLGDVLLGQVAERLRSRTRQSDTLARLGGDEFTVVLTSLHDREEAARVAQCILDALAPPFNIENHEITISASVGISLFPENGADGVSLLQQADSAMYAAKRNGKNQILYFTEELGSAVRERLSLENQLRAALSRGEIFLHYQPEFELSTQRLTRFEALARWTHPTLGSIPPSKFIPIAEETGLIVPLGAYVMDRACNDAVAWQKISPYPIQVAVNVSSLQFTRETLVEEVAEALEHTGLAPGLLQIELTESVMLRGAERAAETMKRLRSLGVTLAIDDFGTGYSCLGYLPKLPFNALKIDRSFVAELESRPETKAMIRSLVTLAHNLGMSVIVEGIENLQQLEIVRRMGVDEAQGFLLGRPTANPEVHLHALQAPKEFAHLHQDRQPVL